jgi:hypothetical protein
VRAVEDLRNRKLHGTSRYYDVTHTHTERQTDRQTHTHTHTENREGQRETETDLVMRAVEDLRNRKLHGTSRHYDVTVAVINKGACVLVRQIQL